MAIATTLDLMEVGARPWDVVVVGAGPAGSVAARELARHGAEVLLVDKASFPRAKVCGCCLNLRALSALSEVGLGGLVDRCGAVSLSSMELAVGGSRARVSLSGKALSREVLDAALVAAAVDAGASFLPETHAHLAPVLGSTRTLVLKHKGRETHAHSRVVLGADGLSGTLLARQTSARAVVEADSRLGAGTVARDGPAFYAPGTIYMACGQGGYVGLVRIEDNRLNVAAAFDAAFVRTNRGLGDAAALILREQGFPPIDGLPSLRWHGTPLLTRHVSRPAADRVLLLGDAASFVEPFSGEGMSWALASGIGVVSFALRACREWSPSLVAKWSAYYRRIILQRQWISRAAARVLRHPSFASLIVAALAHLPVLAVPVVRYLNHAPAVRIRSQG